MKHDLTYVSIRNLKLGETCCKPCGFEKGKRTNLVKYGSENPFGSKEIQEKIKNKNMINLGVPYPMQSKEVQEKSKISNLKTGEWKTYLKAI